MSALQLGLQTTFVINGFRPEGNKTKAAATVFSHHKDEDFHTTSPHLFRQKDPKPCRNLMGSLRGLPSPAAAQLAPLRQCSPLLRTRLHFSAMQKAAPFDERNMHSKIETALLKPSNAKCKL